MGGYDEFRHLLAGNLGDEIRQRTLSRRLAAVREHEGCALRELAGV